MTERPGDLTALGAATASRLIRSRAISASEYAEALLSRVAAREPTIAAWAFIDPDAVRRAARQCDERPASGPLHGVPIGVKDVIDTAGMPTRFNSPIYADRVPEADAECVRRLKQAGAIIMGKLVTTEFAFMRPGPTRNPHDPSRTPGGSSSGSGAAVADGMVPAALATQTGGSTIRPAAYCGVFGYKPPFGAWDARGLKHLAPSLDTIGLCAREVEDLALIASVLGDEAPDPGPLPGPPDLAVCETPYADQAEPAARAALTRAADQAASAGARVRLLRVPQFVGELNAAHRAIMAAETARSFAPEWSAHRQELSSELAEFIAGGLAQSAEALSHSWAVVARCSRWFDAALSPREVILTFSVPGEAPRGIAATGNAIFNRLWTILRAGCVHIPTGRGHNAMPVGVQLVDPRGGAALLGAAAWLARTVGRDR